MTNILGPFHHLFSRDNQTFVHSTCTIQKPYFYLHNFIYCTFTLVWNVERPM